MRIIKNLTARHVDGDTWELVCDRDPAYKATVKLLSVEDPNDPNAAGRDAPGKPVAKEPDPPKAEAAPAAEPEPEPAETESSALFPEST